MSDPSAVQTPDADRIPLVDQPENRSVVSSEVVFEGRVWNVRRDVIAYGESEITRDYVDHTGAVAILALDDEGRILLIQQYRHPIASRDWELPAGLLDEEGESKLDAAKRELAEEVDLEAADWTELVAFNTSPGGSNEVVTVFLARDLTATAAFDRSEEEADIVLRWTPLDEAVSAILDGSLRNSILMIAVLAAHARL